AIESIQRSGGRRPPEELTSGIGRLHAMLSYTTIGEILAGDTGAFLHTIREQCMRIRYSEPISESIMETRMHPRSDSNQHCLTFSLSVSPRCRVFSYRDHLGNTVQHFD